MNLRRVAEWMGYSVDTETDTGLWLGEIGAGLWNPLDCWRDCGPVLAKLCSVGMLCHEFGTPLYFERQVGKAIEFESTTRVTDDATLRKAICEIAEKVSGA